MSSSRSNDPAQSSYLRPAYRADIDGLRAIAVVAVIAFHAFPSYARGGFVGVDIFFVISGFLISTIVFRGLAEGSFSFAAFYARRIKRIFPALIVVLTAFLGLGATVLLAQEYRQLGKHSAASAAFASNLLSWAESGYFDTEAEVKPMLHLWSLAVEEQFYLLWPLLLFLLTRWRSNLLWSTGLIALGSFALNIGTVHDHASAAFYLPLTRMWELLAGALLAWVSLHDNVRLERALDRTVYASRFLRAKIAMRDALALAGMAAIAASMTWIDRDKSFPGWAALLPVTGAFLVIGSGTDAWPNRRILAHRSFVFVGLVSYPLYLWHWPLLSFARILGSGTPAVPVRFGAIGLAFVLAYATYRMVEKPIRASRWQAAPVLLLVSAAAAGSFGYVVYAEDGFAARFPADNTVANNNASFAAYEARMPPCPDSMGGKDGLTFCRLSGGGQPSAAIFGDSHADHLFPGIAGGDRQRTWLLIGHTGCAPVEGVLSHLNGTPEECSSRNDRILSILAAANSISTVVLSANASYYISEGETYTPGYTGAWSPKNWRLQSARNPRPDEEKKAVFAGGLDRTIDILESAGKRVIAFVDVPGLPFMPFDCGRRSTFGVNQVCSIDRNFVMAQQKDYREIISGMHQVHPKVLIFDSIDFLCPAAACDIGKNASYYRDAHHLSLEGSRHAGEAFLSWLNSRGP